MKRLATTNFDRFCLGKQLRIFLDRRASKSTRGALLFLESEAFGIINDLWRELIETAWLPGLSAFFGAN
jgi:hypothetical protein